MRTIEGIEEGTIIPKPQDPSLVSFAPIIRKEDGHIDWSIPASSVFNRIRAFKPWPGSFAFLEGRQLKVVEAAPAEGGSGEAPGTVVESGKHLAVACGEGLLYLVEVQMEGKKRMSAADFLRGHKVQVGTRLE